MVGASTGTPLPMPPPDQFRYDGFAIDPVTGTIDCSYSTRNHAFTESFAFGPGGDWDSPALAAAARLLFLLAGVSYYKTTAHPSSISARIRRPTPERSFLRRYYVHGLAEFAHRNGLDLAALDVVGPDAGATAPVMLRPCPGTSARPLRRRHRLHRHRRRHRPRPPRHRTLRRPPDRTSASPPLKMRRPSPAFRCATWAGGSIPRSGTRPSSAS